MNSKSLHFLPVYIWCREEKDREGGGKGEREKGRDRGREGGKEGGREKEYGTSTYLFSSILYASLHYRAINGSLAYYSKCCMRYTKNHKL